MLSLGGALGLRRLGALAVGGRAGGAGGGGGGLGSMLQQTRSATKKAGGSTKNGRDSPGQRLGVKRFGGEAVVPGNILIRQRGRKVRCGDNVKMGRDHTIYAVSSGWVHFRYDSFKKHQVVSVSGVNPNPLPRALTQQDA